MISKTAPLKMHTPRKGSMAAKATALRFVLKVKTLIKAKGDVIVNAVRFCTEVGMKKITINEIAQRAGVSKTTISFYLNGKTNKMSEETKDRIQQIIDETGYEPSAAARAMKSKGNGAIGVIFGDLSDPFSARALKGIEEVANAMGYQTIVGNSGLNFNNEKDYIDRMLSLGTEGFIMQATYRFGMMAINLEKRNKKVVYIDAKPYDTKGKCIKSSNYDTVYKVITECVKKGYEDFVMVSDDASLMSTGFENTQGYKDALQDLNRKGNAFFVSEEAKSDEVFELLKQNVNLEHKTLLYVASAKMLPVVYQAIRKFPDYMKLFPDTIGLIGFDCEGWTRMTTPSISAIIKPAYEEGQKAAEELLEIIDGKKDEGEVVFKCIVKWRESTI